MGERGFLKMLTKPNLTFLGWCVEQTARHLIQISTQERRVMRITAPEFCSEKIVMLLG